MQKETTDFYFLQLCFTVPPSVISADFGAYPVQSQDEGVVRVKDYIQERVLAIAGYILETGATVRDAAKWYKISKSTVHTDEGKRTRITPLS